MNCHEARAALLVADPAELRGESRGALGEHLSDCARCAELARVTIADLDALGSAVTRRSARIARVVVALVPIAALVVLALSLSPHTRTAPLPSEVSVRPLNTVSVDVTPGQQATVFNTKDPTITVVWISREGGL